MASKSPQTQQKRAREQAVKERRERKQAKKELRAARRRAESDATPPPEEARDSAGE
jgi:hypothetical protein